MKLLWGRDGLDGVEVNPEGVCVVGLVHRRPRVVLAQQVGRAETVADARLNLAGGSQVEPCSGFELFGVSSQPSKSGLGQAAAEPVPALNILFHGIGHLLVDAERNLAVPQIAGSHVSR